MPTELTPELQAWIKHAAFEAAYLEMTAPDPASSHFARRVAEHEARLRQEQTAEGGTVPSSDIVGPASAGAGATSRRHGRGEPHG